MAWYRRLITQKYDGSKNRQNPGRPRLPQEITDLVLRFKEENPHWGYTRIRDCILHLGCKRYLNHLILSSEKQLRYVLSEYLHS